MHLSEGLHVQAQQQIWLMGKSRKGIIASQVTQPSETTISIDPVRVVPKESRIFMNHVEEVSTANTNINMGQDSGCPSNTAANSAISAGASAAAG
jgi:hypothetical protein